MARKDDFTKVKRFCVMCQREIPHERRRDAVTCGKECQRGRMNYIRSRHDQEFCRYCSKPSTPEQRQSYMLWKKMDKQQRATSAAVQKQWSPEQRISFLAWKRRWEEKQHADGQKN